MPYLSFFADDRDASVLLDHLNADPEIAFLVPNGPLSPEEASARGLQKYLESMGIKEGEGFTIYGPLGFGDDGYRQRWKAVRTVHHLKDGDHSLWHVPAGPLPLEGAEGDIPDPWAGWTEMRSGANPSTPYFGPGHPAAIRLDLNTRHRPYTEEEKASLFMINAYWDGPRDHLVVSDIGWVGSRNSPPQTRRWWNRLRTWFGQSATKLGDSQQTFWAFPSALRKLKGGMEYSCRNGDLSESLAAAQPSVRNPHARDLIPPDEIALDRAWLRWRKGAIPAIARRIADEGASAVFPILADTLEEAGCTNAVILDHCRRSAVHARRCWLLDLLLDKE